MTNARNILLILAALFILLGAVSLFGGSKEAPEPEPILTEPTFPELTTKYITAVAWPPKIETREGILSCEESKMINERIYCITTTSEGAAGSVYTTYIYEAQQGKNIDTITFTLRMVQCLNYDDPQKTECEEERTVFNVDQLIDQILTTGGV